MDVLFDLDGTLIDPKRGILRSFQAGLAKVGRSVPPAVELEWVIGPPLRQSFGELGLSAADAETALAAYRESYSAGAMFDAEVYSGIPEALGRFSELGYRLIVATSKPHVFAKPILRHFGLAERFAAIHGAELDGRRDDKRDLIAHIMKVEAVAAETAIMIGDRKFDCLGAAANGLKCIGVLWGYGSMLELRDAGATALSDKPAGLIRLVPWLLKGEA